MSGRVTAADRYRRILAMVPWIAERDAPTLEEVAEHFSITVEQLEMDLDVVLMVGLPPYTPGDFIDVSYESGHIDLRLGDLFTRPLQLSASEALAILTSSTALKAAERDSDGPISRALAKLQVALGVPDGSIEVSLGSGDGAVLATLREALDEHRVVQIEYYSSRSDSSAERRIEPVRLFATNGAWYVHGWCQLAGAHRSFRVDRISSASLIDEHFVPPESLPEAVAFVASDDMERVVFELSAGTRWPTDIAQPDQVELREDGTRRVVVAVGGDAVLARLLVELGDAATPVVDSGDGRGYSRESIERIRNSAVNRIRARYRD